MSDGCLINHRRNLRTSARFLSEFRTSSDRRKGFSNITIGLLSFTIYVTIYQNHTRSQSDLIFYADGKVWSKVPIQDDFDTLEVVVLFDGFHDLTDLDSTVKRSRNE